MEQQQNEVCHIQKICAVKAPDDHSNFISFLCIQEKLKKEKTDKKTKKVTQISEKRS